MSTLSRNGSADTGTVWKGDCGAMEEVGMARVAATLSVLTVLVLGAAVVTADPGMLLALLGAALWALGCAHRGPGGGVRGRVVAAGARHTRHTAGAASRQHHP